MSNLVKLAIENLERVKKKTDSILVAFSGGKESRVVLDLCSKIFTTVIPFHFYFLKNLGLLAMHLDWLKERYGLGCLLYPDKMILSAIRLSLYRPHDVITAQLPDFDDGLMYKTVMHDTSVFYIASGHRIADSLSRRRILARTEGKREYTVLPLKDWTRWDTFAYMKVNNIPIPPSTGQATTGIGLVNSSILWLHDAFESDYEKIKKVFPDIEAHVERRALYGVGEYYHAHGVIKSMVPSKR